MVEYLPFSPLCDRASVCTRLALRPGTPLRRRAEELFPRLEEILHRSLRGVLAYALSPALPALGMPELDGAGDRIVCLATLGADISREITALSENREIFSAYLLDGMANEVLFSAADALYRSAADRAAEGGCHLSRRYAPGDGELPLETNSLLLACFAGEEPLAHITASSSGVLTPGKTLLSIFGADESFAGETGHDCERCASRTCPFRKGRV